MSERIEIGDLVVVVRWLCCSGQLGQVDKVQSFITTDWPSRCWDCGQMNVVPSGTLVAYTGRCYWPVPWLRRIPPLAELESTEQSEKVTA